VRVIGVDEHAWWQTHRGDRFVTVIIDPDPVARGHRTGAGCSNSSRPLETGCSSVGYKPRRPRSGRRARSSRVSPLGSR
jgi:hypothetical protein